MKKTISGLCAFFAVGAFSLPASSMTITAMSSAENLAQALVGSGITIANVTYTGATAASGYFSGGTAAGIGIDSGIVLTSGYASNLNGSSNTSDAITGDNGLVGDAALTALVPGYSTYDATVLQFDFMSQGDAAYFSYAFGSDEYNEWVGSAFNDVFGFFLDGVNVATLPGTSTAVSINNVNGGLNAAYYNNNDPSDTSTPFAFEYDGFTDVLTASMLGLTKDTWYTLTLAIADAGDHVLDSGVFLKAGSFSDTNPEVPEPSTILLMGAGLLGMLGYRRKRLNSKN